MTLGKKGEETKGHWPSTAQDLSRPNLPSWNGLATTTPPGGWSVISQKVATREGTTVKYERSRTGQCQRERTDAQLTEVIRETSCIDLDSSVLAATRPPGCDRRSELPPLVGPPDMQWQRPGQIPSPPWQTTRAESISTTLGAGRLRSCGLFVPVRPL
jgi:hypothetical protein